METGEGIGINENGQENQEKIGLTSNVKTWDNRHGLS